MALILPAFAWQGIFSLPFGMLCPEAETWTGLAGLSLATAIGFFCCGTLKNGVKGSSVPTRSSPLAGVYQK